jgi:hypothetical protein
LILAYKAVFNSCSCSISGFLSSPGLLIIYCYFHKLFCTWHRKDEKCSCVCLVCPVLPVSLDCPFLIAHLVFSNVYFNMHVVQNKQDNVHAFSCTTCIHWTNFTQNYTHIFLLHMWQFCP